MKKPAKKIKMPAMRSPCPIANALDIVGDKWTLLVIRDLFAGKHTFGDFQSSPEGIPTNILADRLKSLQPTLKVLLISGYADDMIDYQHILKSGIPFLSKPFNWTELVLKIREVLDTPPGG